MEKRELKEITLKSGETLILREPDAEDAEAIIEYLNIIGGETDNLLFGRGELNLTVEQEAEYIKKVRNDPNRLMILGIINGQIGAIAQISCLHGRRVWHNSELAISVRKAFWRKGIGSTLMQELIFFAKNHKLIRNISLGVRASNHTAISLYEKFGFVKTGVHKNYFCINGEYDDEYIMDLYLEK